MAKKQSKRVDKETVGRSPAYRINARINVRLGEAFDAYIDQHKPAAKLTAHLELAIEEYLAKRNALPPPESNGESTQGPERA